MRQVSPPACSRRRRIWGQGDFRRKRSDHSKMAMEGGVKEVFEAEGVEVVEGFDAVEVGVVDLGRFGVGSVDVD
jgi:hypothetical protein